jgi:hypothetical protein
VFEFCFSLNNVTIPTSVTSIGNGAFFECYSLTSVTIPNGVTSLGQDVFDSCISLTNVTIPNSVTSLGQSAFGSCINLTGVTIPDSVTSIGDWAFWYCTNMASVRFGDGVSSIGTNALAECFNLTNVCFEGNAPFDGGEIFQSDPLSTIYYVNGTTGWGPTFDGIPTAPCAQCGGSVTITGQVSSACDGSPIAGASVQIGTNSATSDTNGNYNINEVPPGTYSTTVSQSNFITLTKTLTISSSAPEVTNDFGLYPFPDILFQPTNQSVVSGESVTFTVVTACPTNDFYQWQFNGTNLTNNGRITGSSNNSLTIANVQTNDAGTYSVIVTNTAESTNSQLATLTVCALPTVTKQPIGQLVKCSKKFTLSAAFTGATPISFQWFQNDAPVPGATTNSYKIASFNGTDTGIWWLQASNACGVAVSSNIYLDLAPNILVSPASQRVVQGHNAFFGFSACGTVPLPYEWYHNGAVVKKGNDCLTDPTAANLDLASVQPANAGAYQFAVWQESTLVVSKTAKLTVITPPRITKQPVSQTVMQGATAALQVLAAGTKPLSYEWLFNGAKLPGKAKPVLSFLDVSFAREGNYQVIVTNAAGSVTSAVTVLKVLPPAPPTVNSISPTNGPTNGGTEVSITGTWFEKSAGVTFGSLPASSVLVESQTNLVAVAPPSGLGMVNVTITDPGGGKCDRDQRF